MSSNTCTSCVVVLMALVSFQFPSREAQDAAVARIARIDPTDIPLLPRVLVLHLLNSRCAIPQIDLEPHNAIQGQFTRAGINDWAVLCSRDGVSSIRIHRAGEVSDFAEIASSLDRNFVRPAVLEHWDTEQTIGGAFTRRITTVPAAYLRAHLGQTRLVISHDGIGDGVDGKPGDVWYWDSEAWAKLGPLALPRVAK